MTASQTLPSLQTAGSTAGGKSWALGHLWVPLCVAVSLKRVSLLKIMALPVGTSIQRLVSEASFPLLRTALKGHLSLEFPAELAEAFVETVSWQRDFCLCAIPTLSPSPFLPRKVWMPRTLPNKRLHLISTSAGFPDDPTWAACILSLHQAAASVAFIYKRGGWIR